MKCHLEFALCALTIALPSHARAQAQATAPVHVQVLRAPAISATPGGMRLLQELHISNLWEDYVDILSVDVVDPRTGAILRHYADSLLLSNARTFQAQPDSIRSLRIASGQHAILYLNVGFDASHEPGALQFNVTASTVGRARNTILPLQTPAIPITPIEPVVIGAPLQGGPWAVFLGPDTMRTDAHNRMIVGVNAGLAGPQRFAIDLVKLGADGRLWHDSIGSNANWPTFGANVVAVADGVVVEAVDSLPDNTPPDYQRGAANRLVLDIGNGRYAIYAHLKQGSVRARAGARVKRGDVIAQVGNSGNSTGPHLHFQMTDGPSAIAAEGVPYAFDEYRLVGKLTESAEAYENGAVWRGTKMSKEQGNVLPDNAHVVVF